MKNGSTLKFSWLFIIAFYFSFTLLISACSEDGIASTTENTYHHTADIITINAVEHYAIEREYIGEITSKQLTELSFEFGGKVSEINVDNGDIVKAGEVIAGLNTELLTLKKQDTTAEIQQTNAKLALNKANLTRLQTLIHDGYTSEQTLDELTTEKNILIAGLTRLNAALAMVEYQLSQAQIKAPFDGIISQRNIDIGESSAPGVVVFQLIKNNDAQINIGIPSRLASSLTLGQNLVLTINQQQTNASLLAIGNHINATNRTINIRLAPEKSLPFFNGQIVKVAIAETLSQQGFWLPISALTDGIRGQWNIYIAKDQQNSALEKIYQIEKHTVNVLYTTKDQAFITGLPSDNIQIIASGLHRLVPGQIVRQAKITADEQEQKTNNKANIGNS